MSMVYQYTPNKKTARFTTNTTAWRIIASDGTGYDTYANLSAASKTPFPALDPGAFLQYLTLQSENASGAAGSGFYYKIGGTTAPSDLSEAEWAAARAELAGPASFVWVKKVTGTDALIVTGGF